MFYVLPLASIEPVVHEIVVSTYFSFLRHLPSQSYFLEMISPHQGNSNSLLADRRTTSDAHLLIFGTGFPFQQAFPEGANKTNYNYSDVD